ncbi:ribosomal protection-like ABC-F family protein [Paenibacillus sacheonensis]|uniref:ATP-binding cassette domain-containing protein n=1 Tax=Paenibacillus sacheonensis TaxID=742054 RepID=A0A7X5BZI2_9BACL|nr:ABC-F family ATP-binding cassette domain-containing protein [Paenibacillus sacheonensis]MBM7567854.1 ATPase subunit of ABC transporter with duplicated ATPase domains [Paenibacillus sacheonensis]NBC70742.1 ATP-binding cassette domain-containing protein [Paenibacillus sacheonensis]
MLTINCQQVKKYNAAQLVLENVTFELHHGEKAGLVGRNGSGKTTLLRMLAKLDHPDDGLVAIRKNARIGYLRQVPGLEAGMTVRDLLVVGFRDLIECRDRMTAIESAMSSPDLSPARLASLLAEYAKLQERFELDGGYELEARIDQVAEGLRIPREWYGREYASLSGGEKTKVGLASQLLREPELLLLDEPTNHLDMTAVEWLEEFLLKYAGACLIVSHDRYFLDRVVTKIVELEDGESTVFHGNYSRYAKEKEELILRQFADYQEQQKKLKKMRETIKQLLEWGRMGDNGKFFRRAASMQRALDRMEKLKRPAIDRKEAEFELRPSERSGKQVVVLHDVEKRFGTKTILGGVTGELLYGEKVMLVGDNGSGKSTLLKLILGEARADGGEVRLGSRVEVGYLAQQQLPEHPEQSVLDYFRMEAGMEEGEARNRLAAYLFYGADVFKPVSLLSGGEWTRLRLALLVLRKPNLLILDEPTNHMDIASREALEEALEDYPGTILIVTHDRYLINRLAQKIWELDLGRLGVYLGSFGEYTAESGRRKARDIASEAEERRRLRPEPSRAPSNAVPSAKGGMHSAKLEAEINEAERKLAELDAALYEPEQGAEAASPMESMEKMWSEREALQGRLDRLMEQWMAEQGE